MPTRTVFTAVLVALLLLGCGAVNQSVEVKDGRRVDGNVATVNGSVRIGAECEIGGSVSNVNGTIQIGVDSRVGSINNVNGPIRLAAGVQARSAETVNGKITLADGVTIDGELSTVNGTIEAGAEVTVSGNLGTVNGRIALGAGSRVSGEVTALNGSISLDSARIGALRGGNGDISVFGRSDIDGELRVRETRKKPSTPPRIVIGPDARVGGPLIFEQAVELHIHQKAEVGTIEGAKAQYFSGDPADAG